MPHIVPLVAPLLGAALLTACAAPPAALDAAAMVPFACPAAGTRTVLVRSDDVRTTTRWLGADPDQPELCRSRNGRGIERKRLFGRWDFDTERVGGTTEERERHRREIAEFLSGQRPIVGFILRGLSGEQVTQRWVRREGGTQSIGGQDVRVFRIAIEYTYASNGYSVGASIWYAPEYRLFTRSEGALEASRSATWTLTKLVPSRRHPDDRPSRDDDE